MTEIKDNMAVADTMLRAINERKFDLFGEIMAESFVDHHPGLGEGINSRAKYVAALESFLENLDLTAALDLVLTKDNYTVVHGRMSGTHRKEFLGVAPTGNRIEFSFIEVYPLENGKIEERWSLDDIPSLLSGMGVNLFATK